jgi:RHS repeat-associated protein
MRWRNRRRVRRCTSGRLHVYNLRFPGQYADVETGLNYNYYRDYDPATGRYIESDPIGLRGGSYSTYAYAHGNPALLIDPLGLAASCDDRCAQLRKQIFAKAALLIKELLKYDPIADAKGGFPMRWGFTKPGGHYIEITQLQQGLKNDIAEYKRLCSNNNNWPPVPRSIDEAANRDVEVPIITPQPTITPMVPDNSQSVVAPTLGILAILGIAAAFAL